MGFLRQAAVGVMWLGLWGIGLLSTVVAVNKVWHPYGLNRTLQQELEQTRAELEAVQQDNARQIRRIEYLKTPQGKIAEARSLGYHLPGEVPLRLQDPKAQPAGPAKPAPR